MILQVDIKVAPGSHADEDSGIVQKSLEFLSTSLSYVYPISDLNVEKWFLKLHEKYLLHYVLKACPGIVSPKNYGGLRGHAG